MVYRSKFFNDLFTLILCVCVTPCMYVYHVNAWFQERPEEGVRPLGTGGTGICEPPENQSSGPSLQEPDVSFQNGFIVSIENKNISYESNQTSIFFFKKLSIWLFYLLGQCFNEAEHRDLSSPHSDMVICQELG